MTISDHAGKLYTVNKPDELINSVELDSLLSILKYTYISMRMSEDIDILIEMKLIESIDNENKSIDYSSAHEDLIEGFSKKISIEEINLYIQEIKF